MKIQKKRMYDGLPERLPEGETLLWQGRPSWRQLALRAFHVREIAIYFALLLAWRHFARAPGPLPPRAASVVD